MSADCGHEDWMLLPAYRSPAPPLDVERLTILSREMAWAAEETRQRLLVNEEHRDHSPDEGWERLTEFQRDQWIRRAADILARLSRPSDERVPESEAERLREALRAIVNSDESDVVEYARFALRTAQDALGSAPSAPPLDQRAAIDYAVHLMEEAFEGAAPVHAVAIRRHIEVITSLSEQPAPPLDVFDNLLRHHNATCPNGWRCEFAKQAAARLGPAPSWSEPE